jgi:hypothetical protein
MTALQPQAQTEQDAPTTPRTSADVAVELERLEAELDGLPGKIATMERAATNETESQKLEELFAIVEKLKLRKKTLGVQIWNLKQEVLKLEIAEAEEILAGMPEALARAKAEVADLTKTVDLAQAKLTQAKSRIVVLGNQRLGALRTAADKGAELLRLQRAKPII